MLLSDSDSINYEKAADFFKLLANPIRLKILDILISNCVCSPEKGCCVYEINEKLNLPQPYVSKHLKILRDSDILTFERKGNKILYTFKQNEVFRLVLNYMYRFENCCDV